ncbi:hypothetical protein NN3_47250 [Nocardia neocaledoniensis NBRC 108232]|uniref:DoxX-like protein n=1 Tax=Nocardia neocaledoniensis TaxID=236511 RepID=A0A317NWU8_9NOCA|nr:hypothetical protein [Nocardia neocaledoniensis]PWV79413.1 hypothetical protein DFR69_102476 [Nocardia neocaledoniensis]GEM33718.1 hypothetical protein NN3_47250 [Nocardia neocaledoniensis NBRC 108232]
MAFTDTTGKPRTTDDRRGTWAAATLFTRAALGAGFLSAVADRFGLWGDPGTSNVAWTGTASFVTLVAFGGSMFFFSGFETPLNASVFSAAAAAALLALSPPSSHVLAVDRLRG